jgi:hypothetical protein
MVVEWREGEVCPKEGRVLVLLLLLVIVVVVVMVVWLKALRESASIVGESGVSW